MNPYIGLAGSDSWRMGSTCPFVSRLPRSARQRVDENRPPRFRPPHWLYHPARQLVAVLGHRGTQRSRYTRSHRLPTPTATTAWSGAGSSTQPGANPGPTCITRRNPPFETRPCTGPCDRPVVYGQGLNGTHPSGTGVLYPAGKRGVYRKRWGRRRTAAKLSGAVRK